MRNVLVTAVLVAVVGCGPELTQSERRFKELDKQVTGYQAVVDTTERLIAADDGSDPEKTNRLKRDLVRFKKYRDDAIKQRDRFASE